jgi:hypothetical protein
MINFLITFKLRHCCWKHYGSQQRQTNKERSAPLIYCLRATSLSFVTSWQCSLSSLKCISRHFITCLLHSNRATASASHCDSCASCFEVKTGLATDGCSKINSATENELFCCINGSQLQYSHSCLSRELLANLSSSIASKK